MKKVIFLFVALVLISWSQAFADEFTFTFDGPTIDASGMLNAVSNGGGSFTAISGSGTANGVALTLFPNPNGTSVTTSPAGNFYYDNQLFPTQPDLLIDYYGLLFTAATSPANVAGATVTEINIWGNGSASYTYYENYLTYPFTENGTFTLAAVPEPMTMLLLGLGLAGLAGVRRKLKG